MSLSHCLAQLSATSLPGLGQLVPAVATAGLQQLRSLHGTRFRCRSIEQQQQQQQQSLAALSTARFIAAHAQHAHSSDDDAAGSSSLLQAQDSPWYDVYRGAAAASSPPAAPHAADTWATGGRLSALEAGSTSALEAASSTAAAAAAAAGPSSSIADHHISAEGDVVYPEGALLRHIEEHWRQLQACPSAAAYTQRISFDEFGHRYIQQLEREELSRSRALAQLRKEIAADARNGRSYKQGGSVANRLVSAWLPLVAQAIEEEQLQVLQSGGDRAAMQRRDRPNYGPYLLLLSAEDMAHITLQTVLSRIATALPDSEEGDVTVSGSAGISGLTAAQSPTSSDALSGNSSSAVMAPAVLLADSIGRAVNSRVKYLRFKHHQREWDAKEARLQQQQRQQQQQQQQELGEQLSSSLKRYSKANSKEAAEYAEGRSRLESYAALKSLRAASRKAAKSALADVHWDQEARIKVGAALLALLVENSILPSGLPGTKPKSWNGGKSPAAQQQGQPAAAATANASGSRGAAGAGDVAAFEYVYVKSRLKQQSFVRASQALIGVLLADRGLAAHLLTKVPPMLVPPLPWSGYNTGGYLTSRHWIMRTRFSAALQQELKAGLKEQRYSQVLDALNVLGNTSWRINRQVYDTMAALWAARSTAGGLPLQTPLKTPPPPSTGYRLVYEGAGLSARSGGWSKLERRGHVLACDDVRRLNRNMASLKADFLLKLRVAEDYVDAPEFYYPHTLDFRGRAYPLHPSLHHLGDDSCRGLLLFAQGVQLGPQGLDWLYVHLANVWGQGQDKLSFDGRRAFARSHLATILSVATDPLRSTWWQQAEKPWQALAACCEIAGALTSMDPASYVSHLPVHMDGSCNGLQHYAALGRDEAGGRAVNLLPSDTPQDVYKGVAAIVARRVAADAAAGVLEAQRSAALVDRKVVKQTVMTSVYGVTRVGARAQIENRLKERRTDMKQKAALVAEHGSSSDNGWLLAASGMAAAAAAAGGVSSSSFGAGGGGIGVVAPGMRDEYSWMDDRDVVWQVSKYLADLTLDAIGEMFGSARAIMAWLADCARVVSASNAPVSWSSPLGLPIMQPYHKLSLTNIHTATQSFSVVASDSPDSCQWLKARQRSAFPPNFIHSIDSTHMMMTALACSECAITFAGVHDSFWTHAGHVPSMNRLLRDKFVELHTREPDLLQDLLKQLQAQHPGLEFPPIPERGQLAVARVKNSRYFFS